MKRYNITQLTRIAAVVFALLSVYILYIWSPRLQLRKEVPVSAEHEAQTEPGKCPAHDFAQNVVVSVKTGATVANERIPVQANTSLRCAPFVVRFSDLEQDIDGIHIYDALDTVSAAVKDGNPDFDIYREQQELWQAGRNLSSLQGKKHPENDDELAAWTLDKYKNVHIVEKTWTLVPDKDWYVFVDADTYILWGTLLAWLAQLDPNKKAYIGSEVVLENDRFAHGGSGYILSRASMYAYAVEHNGTAAKWETQIKERCCGDLVVGLALQEQGNSLQEVWPLITGETQWTMPFGPHYWCHPQFSMHHMSPADMESLDEWEQQRPDHEVWMILNSLLQLWTDRFQLPVRPKEIFETLIFQTVPSPKDDWNNMADDRGEFGDVGGIEHEAATFEECATACSEDEKCFQYVHDGKKCFLGLAARYGAAKGAEDGKLWRSGWNEPRIKEWMEDHPSCEHVAFPIQQNPD